MTTPDISKRVIRELLRTVSFLGSSLESASDDHLDDTDLGLDSLTVVWLIAQLERRTGSPVSRQASTAAFQSVNTIHQHLLRCETPR